MREYLRRSGKNKYPYWGVFLIFFFLCALSAVFSFQYYTKLQTTIREESQSYLQEVSRQIGNNVTRIIDDNYAVLGTLASVFKNTQADSFADIGPVIETQKADWNYQNIMLIDENGTAYDANGKEVLLNADSSLRSALLQSQKVVSTTQMIDNKEYILFAIPLDRLVVGDKAMIAIAASYDPASFDQVLSMTAFNEQAYSQIISKSGSVIVRSTSPVAFKTGYNVLTSIGNGKLDNGVTMGQIRTEMSQDKAGQISFTLGDIHSYMVYTPIEPEDWYLTTFVPVSVVNAKSDMLLSMTLVICGIIALVFAGLLALLLLSFRRHRVKLEQIAYVDPVIQGNTIQRFYVLAKEALSDAEKKQYALVYTNLEKFKVLNEQYGRSTCDAILRSFNQVISKSLTAPECMGRLTADNFCILIRYTDEESLLEKFSRWFADAEQYIQTNNTIWSIPITEFGIYVIGPEPMDFPQMIDRAKLALKESPRPLNSKLRYAFYDDAVRRQLFRDKHLEDMMETALKNREFQVYLQPKYRLDGDCVGGAEALTRWVSESEGMIFPDEFIPLFERNGFIVQLDLWVFEEVCRTLRIWLDEGKTPMKISINCSRVHLKDPCFLRPYSRITEQYRIPPELLEFELTESIVLEDTQRLTRIIDDIHALGFGCSMDDFGSGYSSLNLIQSIPVDTLKLDKIFFRGGAKDSGRMKSVVGCIIAMAKALSMDTVAEGIEYPEQVEMLRQMGCDYIQGYVFARPMPIDQFEQLAFGEPTT